ncbi:NAD(P)/FAD-dependent oxidoreductase [Alkalihalobacillus sp. LMS39]|uniref:NAD(P)/FAD-dependent oxidoreductase n=1 Tax=Alkalihalobacillus sp. LMS39 TaxID=2924032 RepID=UPI001FB37263|nr:NAD(P)/FAD-dependent oxidoreductase [Alkalihalobacillus sp. LMS39]UOE95987.1 NAD(P)/FAD-dependent oxidoreductase [Alkalihalobacillus sp. LMS39]
MIFDCVIIGGGIAGLQAAIQLGRYDHKILVIDKGGGRSELCQEYHNLLGWPDGVSGEYFRTVGRKQAEQYGVEFIFEEVKDVMKSPDGFKVIAESSIFYGKRILIATGIEDRLPPIDRIKPCLGKSIFLCPDCDGYEIKNKKTVVIGSGNKGAGMAAVLTYWSKDILFINHDKAPIDDKHKHILKKHNIPIYNEKVNDIQVENESHLQGVRLENGKKIEVKHAFLAMSGSKVNTTMTKSIGVERLENHHINVNPRTKETNIPHVFAVGDAIAHSQLLSIAMGDGAQAAIWIHKSLL